MANGMNILSLLEQNARLTAAQLALMTGETEEAVAKQLDEYTAKGVICGYRAVINWEKAGREFIQAFIRIKVTPQPEQGFEAVARRIMTMPEVDGVYLVSGSYDMSLTMSAKNLREVAHFVSARLSPLGSVTSTDTTFVLERYKEGGVYFLENGDTDEKREVIL